MNIRNPLHAADCPESVTGAAAIKWKLAYIQAFDAMEAALRNRGPAAPAPQRELSRRELAAGWRRMAA